jgi:hypothetical protein
MGSAKVTSRPARFKEEREEIARDYDVVIVRLAGGWFERHRQDLGFVLVLGLLMAATVRVPAMEGWDEAFYVSQLTSMAGDGDLLLHDDLLAFENRDLARRLRPITETSLAIPGALANNFGAGSAVIHGFYLWPALLGRHGPYRPLAEGYALGSIALLALTALATRGLILELGFSSSIACVCSLAACYFGPLAVYGTRLQLASHLPSAFCAACALWLAWRWNRDGGRTTAILLGFFAGMAAIVRWQDAVLSAVLIPFLLRKVIRAGERRRQAAGELAGGAAVLILLGVLQLMVLDKQNGRILGIPQGGEYVSFAHPHLASFLLSPRNGLVPWAPAFALGLGALAFGAAREREPDRRWLFGTLAALAVLQCYVSATPVDWWGSSSYGPRRLSGLTAAAALGLALVARPLSPRARAAGVTVFALWMLVTTGLFAQHVDDVRTLFHAPGLHVMRWISFLAGSFSLPTAFGSSALAHAAGVAACVSIGFGAAALWRAVVETPRGRTVAASLAIAWTGVCLLAVAGAPSNEAANAAWRAMDRGEEADRALAGLQPEVAAAGHVLAAWRAIRSGDVESARRQIAQARSPQFPIIGLADLALVDEAAVRRGDP